MATDLEKLVVQLSADIRGYEREMRRAQGVTDRQARAIEGRFRSMNRNLDGIGRGAARALIAPLAGIAATLSVREVIRYADAWKRAENQLKVAGVPADRMAATMERLFGIAQGAGAGLEPTVTLFSRLSQTSKELGATQEELFTFTQGVGDALKVAGTSAGQAQGALLQLSQALGGAVVRSEEFNSINEGARPILQAVANGLDATGGSVAKLRNLVIEGKVSSQEFFRAFLEGSNDLARQAALASTTFDQAFTKIGNAFTKYIGETDEGLGASQRLISGLEALADNFGTTADVALKFAGILAAGLLGRSIAGMIVRLGSAAVAVRALGVAFAGLRAGGLAAALPTIGSAAGPIGAALGVAAAAALYFATSADDAAGSTEAAATSADRYAEALRRVKGAAEEAGDAAETSGARFQETETNRLRQQQEFDTAEAERAAQAVRDYLDELIQVAPRRLVTEAQLDQLAHMAEGLGENVEAAIAVQEAINKLANDDPDFQPMADQLNPLLDKLIGVRAEVEKTKSSIELLEATGEVAPGGSPSFRQAEAASMAAYQPTADFLSGRTAEAQLSDFDRALQTRTDKILEEAEKLGLAISEAAARMQAQVELGISETAQQAGADLSSTADLIKHFEGFISRAKYDVNAFRVGFGSDTLTSPTGEVSKVTESSITTLAAAERDLNRRIGEFQAVIVSQIGAAFGEFTAPVQAALTSVAYNYGRLPESVAAAARTGNVAQVAQAVEALPANPQRRQEEATLIRTGQFGLTEEVETTRELATAKADLIAGIEREIAALGLEAEAFGQTTLEAERARVAFDLMEQAKQAGLEITPELAAKLNELANRYAEATVKVDEFAAAQSAAADAQSIAIDQMDSFRDATKDVLSGFISDLRDGKSASEALANALDSIADKLIDAALDSFITSLFGARGTAGGGLFGGGSGGLLGGAIIPGILHKGGVAGVHGYGHGRTVPASTFVGAPRYHDGTISAGLRPGEVPAILQRGEVVLPRLGRLPASGGGRGQPIEVRNVVAVEPNPLFAMTVRQEVVGGIARNNSRVPGIVQDKQRRYA